MEKQHLLLIRSFGTTPLVAQSRASLLETIEDNQGKSSNIITSQIPISKWYEVIWENIIADTILDRLVHDWYRIELKGESLRKRGRTKKDESVEFTRSCNVQS